MAATCSCYSYTLEYSLYFLLANPLLPQPPARVNNSIFILSHLPCSNYCVVLHSWLNPGYKRLKSGFWLFVEPHGPFIQYEGHVSLSNSKQLYLPLKLGRNGRSTRTKGPFSRLSLPELARPHISWLTFVLWASILRMRKLVVVPWKHRDSGNLWNRICQTSMTRLCTQRWHWNKLQSLQDQLKYPSLQPFQSPNKSSKPQHFAVGVSL